MRKKSFLKKFRTEAEMDEALESADLSKAFETAGVVKKVSIRKINLDLPVGVVREIDLIAEKVGVSRQPLLKIWIHERLKEEASK